MRDRWDHGYEFLNSPESSPGSLSTRWCDVQRDGQTVISWRSLRWFLIALWGVLRASCHFASCVQRGAVPRVRAVCIHKHLPWIWKVNT